MMRGTGVAWIALGVLGCSTDEQRREATEVASSPRAEASTPVAPSVPHQSGVSVRAYLVGRSMDRLCTLVANQTPNVSVVLPVLDIASDRGDKLGDLDETFMVLADGYLVVPEAGTYVLRLASDDGAVLFLDGGVCIDHDGLHSKSARERTVELTAGEHPFRVQYFQNYGGFALELSWKRPRADAFEVVPASALACTADEVRVTSPGPKRVLFPLEKGTPGDGLPLAGVHPSCDLSTVRPAGFEPRVGGMDWLSDGRLVIATWDAIGAVYIVEGVTQDDPAKLGVTRFAAGLLEPLGLCVVDDRIFVLQKVELTELVDKNKDGKADEYRSVSSDFDLTGNFHEFAFGLVYKDGYFYANLAVAIDPGGRSSAQQAAGRGSTIKISLETGEAEIVAHGERTPNGIGFGPEREIFLTDNQGDWVPTSKLLHLEEGAYYGSRAVLMEAAEKLAETPPALWLPQNEIGNSPSNPASIPDGWGPYSGQMVHGDVTYGGIQRDFLERVDDEYQGAVFRFTQGLEAGVNRVSFGPDGALYVGGIGSTGNWGQEGKQSFGLQRLRYAARPAFEMLAMRACSNGFEIEFTEPVADEHAWDVESYWVDSWRYVPTSEYGGPKIDPARHRIASATLSADRTRVFLEIPDLREGTVVHVRIVGPVEAAAGRKLWSTETWYTLNRIPRDVAGIAAPAPGAVRHNALTEEERAQGWRLLFDGKSLAGWRAYDGGAVRGWAVEQGELVRVSEGGDIVTDEEFTDFELALEWKISPGGNSGIFFHVADGHAAVWETGPEMQVLDNERHADGRNPLTSAGSNYALHAPAWDATRPVGLFNRVRLRVERGHVEHWLNGTKVVEYDLSSPEWQALVRASKFAAMPDYGRSTTGRIALQDHGDRVSYRDVKIRPLGGTGGARRE